MEVGVWTPAPVTVASDDEREPCHFRADACFPMEAALSR
jgi:hypothetical protein